MFRRRFWRFVSSFLQFRQIVSLDFLWFLWTQPQSRHAVFNRKRIISNWCEPMSGVFLQILEVWNSFVKSYENIGTRYARKAAWTFYHNFTIWAIQCPRCKISKRPNVQAVIACGQMSSGQMSSGQMSSGQITRSPSRAEFCDYPQLLIHFSSD